MENITHDLLNETVIPNCGLYKDEEFRIRGVSISGTGQVFCMLVHKKTGKCGVYNFNDLTMIERESD